LSSVAPPRFAIPVVRRAGAPSGVSSCHVASRVARIRSTIISIAVSSGSSSHSVACGRRYSTRYSRSGPEWRLFDAAPFGHSRPREIGLAGSPSTWITSPSFT
jgi:hypothetical protein